MISHTIPEENSSEILETRFHRVSLVQEGYCYKRIIIISFRIFCGLLAKEGHSYRSNDCCIRFSAMWLHCNLYNTLSCSYVQKKILLNHLQLYNYKNIHKCVFPFALVFNLQENSSEILTIWIIVLHSLHLYCAQCC